MTNITELTEVTAVAGTDVLYCVQGSNDRKCTPAQLATYLFSGNITVNGVRVGAGTGTYNTVLGNSAGSNGAGNVALGLSALAFNESGNYNVAIGCIAGLGNSTGSYNIVIGYEAGRNLLSSDYNIGIGYQSLRSCNWADRNIAIGAGALYYTNSESYDTIHGKVAIGYQAGYHNYTGTYNLHLGYQSGYGVSLDTGSNNTGVGTQTLYSNSSGSGNVAVGYKAGYSETGSNKLYIENSDSATPLIYGEFDNDLVRIYGQLYARKTTEQFRLEYDTSNYASFTVSSAGVLTLTTSANKIALGASRTPASATDTGTAGEVCWDANYVYVCVAANTWRRAALSSW